MPIQHMTYVNLDYMEKCVLSDLTRVCNRLGESDNGFLGE